MFVIFDLFRGTVGGRREGGREGTLFLAKLIKKLAFLDAKPSRKNSYVTKFVIQSIWS